MDVVLLEMVLAVQVELFVLLMSSLVVGGDFLQRCAAGGCWEGASSGNSAPGGKGSGRHWMIWIVLDALSNRTNHPPHPARAPLLGRERLLSTESAGSLGYSAGGGWEGASSGNSASGGRGSG